MTENLSVIERRLLQSVMAEETGNQKELYSYQEEALKQLRGAFSYISTKYPDADIEYLLFEPLTKVTEKGIIACTLNGGNELARVIIRCRNGSYSYADTVYSSLIREVYDRELESVLAPFMPGVRAHTVFYTPAGNEVNGQTSLREICGHLPPLSRHTELAVGMEPEISGKLIERLRAVGFYGSYAVCVSGMEERQDCRTFNVFRAPSETGGGE